MTLKKARALPFSWRQPGTSTEKSWRRAERIQEYRAMYFLWNTWEDITRGVWDSGRDLTAPTTIGDWEATQRALAYCIKTT